MNIDGTDARAILEVISDWTVSERPERVVVYSDPPVEPALRTSLQTLPTDAVMNRPLDLLAQESAIDEWTEVATNLAQGMIVSDKPYVLIADVDPDFRRVLEEIVTLNGPYRVIHVANGMEALGKLRDYEFAAMFLEIDLPHVSGLDVLRSQREDLATPTTGRIVFITARWGEPDVRKMALEAGADAVLPKPFEIDALEAEIARIPADPRSQRDTDGAPRRSTGS